MGKYKTQSSPSSFNMLKPGERPTEFAGFFERGMTKDKANTLDGYLEMLGDYFDHLEVYSTLGWGMPNHRAYPFQWIAYAKPFIGDDDAYEGTGKSPLEAVRNLYHAIGADYPTEEAEL